MAEKFHHPQPADVIDYAIIEGRGLVQMDVKTLHSLIYRAKVRDQARLSIAEKWMAEDDPRRAVVIEEATADLEQSCDLFLWLNDVKDKA